MTDEDLIAIDEAARILRRSVHTVRRWDIRGFAPSGVRLRFAMRDAATGIRLFRRADVMRVRQSMLRVVVG